MKKTIVILACLCMCGCARLIVPVGKFKIKVGEVEVTGETPKNYETTNLCVRSTIVDRWGNTNYIEVHMDGLKAKMDPVVVQMSGDTFIQTLKTAGELGGTVLGKAAK